MYQFTKDRASSIALFLALPKRVVTIIVYSPIALSWFRLDVVVEQFPATFVLPAIG